ncbi:MarR family winged helix-turn-helix transcriptional regulator [Scandinavium sp. H11S7]|uniref:MarR family winged helix-turn-helix transcriptional regulator n=1 Tax=Scandinavium hiltneri TaxID=2926519 RepID=UPI002165B29C|nr:MarR family winged helix-turn-helix transcriptional regulator [Scandinavium hiltneri]MCS2159018.1 MarR family winged helix-turn-helix transcriptional regulator [Scandinavium hiltneri]
MTNPHSYAVDHLIGKVFLLYGAIVSSGDAIASPLGLTSARWQIMGAIDIMGATTVSDLARQVGVTRQSVQRIVNEMVAEGYFVFMANPHHRRAKNIAMTDKGLKAHAAISQIWNKKAEQIDQYFGSENLNQLTQQLIELQHAFSLLNSEQNK